MEVVKRRNGNDVMGKHAHAIENIFPVEVEEKCDYTRTVDGSVSHGKHRIYFRQQTTPA